MAVHVGELHTDLSGTSSSGGPAPGASIQAGEPRHPGAPEDEWRSLHAREARLRGRVCAEDFDD